jgi:hypothetical protein
MAWTTFHENLLLSDSWQLIEASNRTLYRFSVVSGDFGASGKGRYEVGQFDSDGSGYGFRLLRTEAFGLIVGFVKPNFFETQRLGFRVPIGFNPFTLKIEVNDMPFYNLGNPISASSATSTTIPATITAAVLATADLDSKQLIFNNTSNKSLFLKFGGDVSLTNFDVEVKTNTIYEMPVEFTGVVNGIWAAGATGSVKVTKFV